MREDSPISQRIDSLIQSHGRRVLALLCDLLGNRGDAEDVYQETWCALWKAQERLVDGPTVWPYIRTTAVRKAIDFRRSRGRLRERLIQETDPEPCSPQPRDDELSLAGIPEGPRACLVLFFREGLSVTEIASELDIPPGTVKTWMFRAREQLRSRLLSGSET